MSAAVSAILSMAAPLLFATLGALCTEYAGVLAVFMDGAISFAGFVCVAAAGATGSAFAGFAAACIATMALLAGVALFTERTKANPFLTGLSVNLFAAGITSWCSASWFGTRGVIPLSSLNGAFSALSEGLQESGAASLRDLSFPLALGAAVLLHAFLKTTGAGLALSVTGSSPDVLAARGVSPARYRTASWYAAAFFAACAGSVLTLGLGAWVPNVSAGRGWTALAAVYLGHRNPLLCVLAVLVFAGAEYLTTVLQGFGRLPATLILGLPYALALVVFVFVPRGRR